MGQLVQKQLSYGCFCTATQSFLKIWFLVRLANWLKFSNWCHMPNFWAISPKVLGGIIIGSVGLCGAKSKGGAGAKFAPLWSE